MSPDSSGVGATPNAQPAALTPQRDLVGLVEGIDARARVNRISSLDPTDWNTPRGYLCYGGGGTPGGYPVEEERTMAVIEFQVTGMTCGHCEMSIRNEVGQIPGVENIDVSAQTGKLVVTASQPVEDGAVLAAVDEAGYSAVRV